MPVIAGDVSWFAESWQLPLFSRSLCSAFPSTWNNVPKYSFIWLTVFSLYIMLMGTCSQTGHDPRRRRRNLLLESFVASEVAGSETEVWRFEKSPSQLCSASDRRSSAGETASARNAEGTDAATVDGRIGDIGGRSAGIQCGRAEIILSSLRRGSDVTRFAASAIRDEPDPLTDSSCRGRRDCCCCRWRWCWSWPWWRHRIRCCNQVKSDVHHSVPPSAHSCS